MKYIVQSTAVWDRISLSGSSAAMEAPGGAGFYALAGMKVWEDDVGIVSGIGADYLPKFGDWYQENHLPTEGLLVKDPHSPQTLVQYAPDGERTERPVFGEAHYHSIEATPQELAPFCQDAAGVYVFKNLDPSYWEGLLPLKKKYGFHLMWEIAADAAVFENYGAVKKLAEQTSVFSINRTEALQLTQAASLEDAIAVFHGWDLPLIYLRLGSRGTCLLQKGRSVFVPSVPGLEVVDATGGGNSSTGGAFIGYCRGCSLEEIGAMGNVSASFCIEQWGAPTRLDYALRQKAQLRKEQVLAMCREAGTC